MPLKAGSGMKNNHVVPLKASNGISCAFEGGQCHRRLSRDHLTMPTLEKVMDSPKVEC